MSDWIALPQVACGHDRAARPVAWRDGRAVDRDEFLAQVGRWQHAFAAQPDARWALWHDDPCEFAAALYGAWHAGKRVALPGDMQPATLARLRLDGYGFAGTLPGGLQTVAAGGDNAQARRPLDPERTQLVLFTSGSSGEPQAIAKTLAQLDAEVHAQHALHGHIWAARGALTVHASASHQHIYGLLFVILWPLAAGCRIDTRRIVYAEEMAARLGPAPTLLVSSPAHLKRLHEDLDWSAARSGLRAVLSSGGPLPADAADQARRCFGVAPIEIYGSSETGGIAWRQRSGYDERWLPLPGVIWRIGVGAPGVDGPDGRSTDHDRIPTEGLLELRSPFLPDEDWHCTEDRVRAEPDGGFALLGRSDRIVKIEERRVSLTAIEHCLLESPLVADARVLVLERGRGLRVAAALVLTTAGDSLLQRQGRRAVRDELRARLDRSIERIALPRLWRYVDALPANAQGKVTDTALRALFVRDLPEERRWLERGPSHARAMLTANAGHAAFRGHFPAAPILPGVIQLDWVISLAREAFTLELPVRRLEALKFHAPVLPGTRLEAMLEWDASACRLGFECRSVHGVHASGRVRFGSFDV